ncbi:MAG TPA: putative peptidoglycan glycosyltransferase FtsW [Gemmatimonadales bacterium]|nr:putative peptidoglycan glycosyltransferase FtsW [Gemmatimonadales bacterium]
MPPPIRHPGEMRWETRLLLMIVAVLAVFGIVAVYGASSMLTKDGRYVDYAFALTQVSGAAIGGIFLIIASRVDYYLWRKMAWPLLLGTLVLLLITVLPGTEAIAPTRNGARRWIDLGPVNFQPSELARLSVVVWCAMLASKKGELVRGFKKGVMPFIVVLGLVFLLVLLEPNMSMAVLLVMLGGIVLFVAGAKLGHFVLLTGAGLLLGLTLIQSAPYRLARLTTFLNGGDQSEAAWQITNAMIGFGSGQLVGVGLGEGSQKMGFTPYAYSDFLFSHIGEEWGFIGVCFIVALFAVFCWLGFRIARTAAEPFGQYLAVGITALVGVSAVLHMAVNTKLMPTTGITLPFVSWGRSSQVIAMLAAGILINIGRMRGRPRAVPSTRQQPRSRRASA